MKNLYEIGEITNFNYFGCNSSLNDRVNMKFPFKIRTLYEKT